MHRVINIDTPEKALMLHLGMTLQEMKVMAELTTAFWIVEGVSQHVYIGPKRDWETYYFPTFKEVSNCQLTNKQPKRKFSCHI